ncbi:DUF255 domain-containing protein [Bacillus subtilis]|uniref:DUF255 domain-containing protein n=1 Tax=Bacillus subtilis TaxID=1423 RepID=UPI0009B57C3C
MPTNNKSNKLIAEKSPYLLQHAHNPVGTGSRRKKKPSTKQKKKTKICIVSIGYSCCHWWRVY